eukprot:4878457-Pyramimonas_sp.AAC.1
MGVTKTRVAVASVSFACVLALGQSSPRCYFICPSTHCLFSEVKPSEVTLMHGNPSTKLDVWKVFLVVFMPRVVVETVDLE